jgi:vacuolar-type H+-ATPase subunit F/Vma7
MSYGVRVLCRPAVAAGFRLAGVTPTEAADPADGARLLRVLLDDPAQGVILVEDEIYAAIPDTTRREISRRPLPMVVPIPSPTWARPAEGPEAFIAELLRQAIGYRVKLG